jgi:hypothetical protein
VEDEDVPDAAPEQPPGEAVVESEERLGALQEAPSQLLDGTPIASREVARVRLVPRKAPKSTVTSAIR